MSISAVSLYRGGTEETVKPLSRRMKSVLLKYGVGYQVGHVQSDRDVNEWMVIVHYPDRETYDRALECFGDDLEHRLVVKELGKVVKLTRRELIVGLDL